MNISSSSHNLKYLLELPSQDGLMGATQRRYINNVKPLGYRLMIIMEYWLSLYGISVPMRDEVVIINAVDSTS